MSSNRADQSNATAVNSNVTVGSGSTMGKYVPKDGQVIMAIMKELGLTEFDPKVITQLLEFIYKYTTTVLDDARLFALHAKKKTIEIEDVKLAITMQTDRVFACPPPRDLLLDLTRSKNSMPLQSIKVQSGIKLPQDRYCLLQTNYKLKSSLTTRRDETNKSSFSHASSVSAKDKYISPHIKQMPIIPQSHISFNIPEANKLSEDLKLNSPSDSDNSIGMTLDLNNLTEKSEMKDDKEMLDIMDITAGDTI